MRANLLQQKRENWSANKVLWVPRKWNEQQLSAHTFNADCFRVQTFKRSLFIFLFSFKVTVTKSLWFSGNFFVWSDQWCVLKWLFFECVVFSTLANGYIVRKRWFWLITTTTATSWNLIVFVIGIWCWMVEAFY